LISFSAHLYTNEVPISFQRSIPFKYPLPVLKCQISLPQGMNSGQIFQLIEQLYEKVDIAGQYLGLYHDEIELQVRSRQCFCNIQDIICCSMNTIHVSLMRLLDSVSYLITVLRLAACSSF
jgi:hypothetical protein